MYTFANVYPEIRLLQVLTVPFQIFYKYCFQIYFMRVYIKRFSNLLQVYNNFLYNHVYKQTQCTVLQSVVSIHNGFEITSKPRSHISEISNKYTQ